jgi:hypothetical protein
LGILTYGLAVSRHEFAQSPLRTNPDLSSVDLQLLVLCLLGVGPNGIGLGADLPHVVDRQAAVDEVPRGGRRISTPSRRSGHPLIGGVLWTRLKSIALTRYRSRRVAALANPMGAPLFPPFP